MRLAVKILTLFLLLIVPDLQAQLEWERVAPLQTPRAGHAAVSYEGRIYVLGGLTHRGLVLNSTEIYNPDTDVWESGPSLPMPLRYHNAVVANDTIYIFGGFGPNLRISNRLFKYKPGNGIISGPDLPVPLFGMSSVVSNGRILVMGGRLMEQGIGANNSGYEFNLRNQEWSEAEYSMNFGRSNFLLVDGDFLLAIGGIDFGVVNSLEVLRREGWQAVSRMLNPRGHFSGVALGDRVVIAGGVGQHHRMRPLTSVDLFIFNGRESSWERLPDMLDPRTDFAMIELNEHIYAIGGISDARRGNEIFINNVERLSSELSVSEEEEVPRTPTLVSASPNPTNGRVKFRFPMKAKMLRIIDLNGHIIESRDLSERSSSWIWDTEPVPAGLYFYVIEFDRYTNRIIDRITVIK